MTISTTAIRVDYAGNGVSTAFAIPFAVFDATHVVVIERAGDTGAETVLTQGTDYSVSLNPDQNTAPGGTVTAATAPASGVQWTIRRDTARVQGTDYVENDNFPADTAERTVDKPVAMIQEVDESLTRTLRLPRSDSASAELPTLAGRVSKIVGFGAAGELTMYPPPSISGLSEVLPDGATAGVSADLLIRKLIEVDIYAFGAHPSATAAQNDAAIALAVARVNDLGGVLAAELVRGDYSFSANIPALTHARGITMRGSRFICTDADQTGPFLSLGRLVTNGIQSPVLRGVAVVRDPVSDWTDETQIGLLLRCVQNIDGDIAEAQGFTIPVRLTGEYDGTTAADCVHNKIALGRLWNGRYLLDLYSDSPAQAGAVNNNRFLGGDFTAQTGVNDTTDRYAIALRRRTWFTGTFTANATDNELTLTGTGTIPPVNARVTLSTAGTIPTGLVAGTYYVVSSAGSVIKLGVTAGGAAVDFSDSGIGIHSIVCRGYNSHNTNLWVGPSFQHARGAASVAYCVLSEVDPQQNRIASARAEWTAPAVMRASLTSGGGGANSIEVDYATSYLPNELTDEVSSGATRAAWRTRNNRYSAIANDAMRAVLVVPDLRAELFQDWRDGVLSYGFDRLHVCFTTAPSGGVGTATTASCALRNDQRSGLTAGQGIMPNADSVTIGAGRGIGVFVDCAEAKWFYPVCTQAGGARSVRWAVRVFDASGVLLGDDVPVLIDHPSVSLSWNGTTLCWQASAAMTDADQAGRVCFRMPAEAKFAQFMLLYAGADIAEVQSFAIYTPDPYPVRAFHGVAGGTRELVGSVAWDPPNLVTGTSTSKTTTLAGVARGDLIMVSMSVSTGNLGFSGSVQGNDTPVAVLSNGTGSDSNVASGTLTFTALKQRIAQASVPANDNMVSRSGDSMVSRAGDQMVERA